MQHGLRAGLHAKRLGFGRTATASLAAASLLSVGGCCTTATTTSGQLKSGGDKSELVLVRGDVSGAGYTDIYTLAAGFYRIAQAGKVSFGPDDFADWLDNTKGFKKGSKDGFNPSKELAVIRTCGFTNRKEEVLYKSPESHATDPLAILKSLVLEPLFTYVVDQIDKSIQEELQAYSAIHKATETTTDFYEPQSLTERNGAIAATYSCIRYTRTRPLKRTVLKEDKETGTPHAAEKLVDEPIVDLIAQIKTDGDALWVRPLRLFYSQKTAEKGTKFKASISLEANAVWRQGNRGKTAGVFNHVFARAERNRTTESEAYFSDESYFTYYFELTNGEVEDNWHKQTPLPLPAFSADPVRNGTVTLTMHFAEQGNAPDQLKAIAKAFSKQKGAVAEALADAAYEALPK